MKIQKRKNKHPVKERVSLRSMLAQPPTDFYRIPEFSVRGGYLTTDGCRRVLDFAPEKISLDMGNFLVTFYGTELRIESLSGRRLILAGKIRDISFRNKWEVSGDET